MELADAARDEAAFSMRVLRHLACGRDGGASNLAVSPLSLHAALALLGAGARGATLDQIVAFLGPAGGNAHAKLASHVALRVLSSDTTGWDGGPTVLFSNSVWLDTALQLSDSFARVVAEHYRAVARLAPFKAMPEEARSQINEWIASATAGRIRNLLPPGSINTATPAVLANALYFKGDWSRKFDALLASYDAFYVPNGGPVRVPFMSSTSKQYIARRHGYKVLRLPYAGASQEKTFSMYIYLPDDHHGLPSLLQKLSSDPALLESSTTLTSDVPMGAFRVPKFTVSYKTNVKEMLRDLGLRLPLNSGLADFGDMVEAPPPADPLFVSEVYHECVVDVNEEGTEAFAATSFCMRATGFQRADAPEDFVADHPFMFFIKEDRSGVVVFAGQVIDPSHRMWTHP